MTQAQSTKLNVRQFREEVAEAFLKGFELSLDEVAYSEIMRVASQPGGLRSAIIGNANRYATTRVMENKDKLDPMS